jgi:integrase
MQKHVNIYLEQFNKKIKPDDRKNKTVIHTLRHTFASHLAINYTPIFTIQKLMNHSDIKMTMRYAKLAPDSGREFIDKLFV